MRSKSKKEFYDFCKDASYMSSIDIANTINPDWITSLSIQALGLAPYIDHELPIISYSSDAEYGWDGYQFRINADSPIKRIPENNSYFQKLEDLIDFCLEGSEQEKINLLYSGRSYRIPRLMIADKGELIKYSRGDIVNSDSQEPDRLLEYLKNTSNILEAVLTPSVNKAALQSHDEILCDELDLDKAYERSAKPICNDNIQID